MTAPYSGLRVLDLSTRLSGAFAARLFGDLGANVVMLENPQGHPLRLQPPFLTDEPGPNRGVLHAYVNWNKRSVVVHAEEEVRAFVKGADLVVTDSPRLEDVPFAGALAVLAKDAVHVSVTPYGLHGLLAGTPGNNLTTSARTGWANINGYRDEPPLQMPRNQAGYIGGVAAFLAAASALRRRTMFDQPETVSVSEVEAFALTVHPWAIAAIYEDIGWSYGPAGGRQRGEPGPLYDAADGRMNFGFGDFHNWREAMRVLRLPELAEREDLLSDIGRHSRDLSAVVAGAARTLPELERWPVFHALAQLRCNVGVVQDIGDIVRDPQLGARNFLVETEIEGSKVRAAGPPARLSPGAWRLARSAPQLDEHNSTLVQGWSHPRLPVTTAASSLSTASEGPLKGVRVLSLCQAWSGTFGTELLALLGADVVQIGSLHRPDVWRRVRDRVPRGVFDESKVQHPLNTQGLYNSVNLNKREICLDLRDPRGMEIFWELLPRFDVLAENFRPTVMPSWGITLDRLHEERPGMIWASISAYGSDGPYREYPGNGATTEPMAGLSSLHGYEGDPGMNTGGLYPDPVAGYFLAGLVVAALNHRDLTGLPQRIDLSMMEAVAVVCGDAIVEYGATGRVPGPTGNHHPAFAPHNMYQAANGAWIAIAVESDEQWVPFLKLVGDERLAEEGLRTCAGRKAREAELDAIVAEWCATKDAAELERELLALGIPAACVAVYYDLYSGPSPESFSPRFVSRIEHPETGPTWLPGRPWQFSAAESAPLRPSPCLGQHSREILVGELGLEESYYQQLVAEGVTGTLDDLAERS